MDLMKFATFGCVVFFSCYTIINGELTVDGSFENTTAQLNITTAQDVTPGQPGLYSGETVSFSLNVDLSSNISSLAVELSFPALFISSDSGIAFPRETFIGQNGFLNQLTLNDTTVSPTSIKYSLGDAYVVTGLNRLSFQWDFNLTSHFTQEINQLDCSVRLYNSSHTVTPFVSLLASIKYLGADLFARLQRPYPPVEGGDNLSLTIVISQDPDASDYASDTQVTVNFGNSFVVKTISFFTAPSVTNNSTALTLTPVSQLMSGGLTVSKVNYTHPLYIRIDGVISDTVELNYHIPIEVSLNYYDGNRTDPQISKSLQLVNLLTKSPVITAIPSNLPSSAVFTYPVTMEITVQMGIGKLSRLHVNLDGTTPPSAVGLSLTLSVTQTSVPTEITVTENTNTGRKKRAITDSVLLGTFYNPSINPALTPIIIKISFRVTAPSSVTNIPVGLVGTLTGQTYGTSTTFLTDTITLVEPLSLTKTVQLIDGSVIPNVVLFEVVVNSPLASSLLSYNLRLYDDTLPAMKANVADSWFLKSAPSGSNLQITNDNTNFQYTVPSLPAGNNVTLRYSSVTDNSEDDDDFNDDLELVYYQTSLTFYTYDSLILSYPPDAAIRLQAYACLWRTFITETSIVYQYGFAALSFFIALIVGALIALLIIFLLIRVCKKNLVGSIRPDSTVDNMVRDKGNRLLMGSSPMKKGGHTITDLSMVGINDSIVAILALKDKLQMYREIDNLDIVNTITVDTELESERNKAMSDASTLLVRGLRVNGDVTKETEDKSVGTFQTNARNLEKKLDEEYRLDCSIIFKDIRIKNKNKLSDLIHHQCEDKRRVVEETTAMEEKDRRELMDMLDQQHDSEQNEITYKLKLEQDELTEKLRKEYAVRKRMGLKEIQQQLMDDTIAQGKLVEQQADWLIKEHQTNQAEIDKMYDNEISRQRMRLEEKLARRRALAQASDLQEDDESDILNTMAGHQIETVKDMKKRRVISASEAAAYVEKLQTDMINLKTNMETERAKQEQDLHQRMSALKAKKLSELTKQQEQELGAFNKKSQEQQTDGPIEPISFIQARQEKISELRQERDDIDTDLDLEHAGELESLRKKSSHQTETQMQAMEDKTLDELKRQHDVTDEQVRKILKQHEREVEGLRANQAAERESQRQRLAEKVQKNKKEAFQRQADERLEQQQLRDHETTLVQKLLNNQMSMSEEERDKILKEHEKQMVKLENSLTLNKLRQKKMLEDKIAEKRSLMMEKLEMKQDREYKKLKRTQENNGEESDEDGLKVQLSMMKRHTEQKLAVIQGQRVDIDQELEGIRVEMMKERAMVLKDQEERLGAMLATLQMEKARELVKIEQQQKAINNLKVNLMDDLTDRGVLSNPECQRVIDVHRQEQNKLQQRLDSQRVKQERFLRIRLEQRLQQREQLIGQIQEKEVESASKSLRNKTSIKVKKMLMMTKHMVESEKFRNQMERERDQTLESMTQQYEVMKLRAMQEQELQFISGLIRLGRFKKSELASVVKLLFPGRSPEEMERLLKIMCEHAEREKTDEDKDNVSLNSTSRLEDRVKATTLTSTLNSTSKQQMSLKDRRKSMGRQPSKQKFRQSLLDEDIMDQDDYDFDTSYKSSRRPETLGQDDNSEYVEASLAYDDETFSNRRRLPPPPQGALDPIEVRPKRKKKKSALKKLADKNVRRFDDYPDEYSV